MTPINYELEEPPEIAEDLSISDSGRAVQMAAPVVLEDADDDIQIEQRAQVVDKAFGVKPFFWKGQQLAAFAIDREADWMMHRELIGEPPIFEILSRQTAMLADALRVLWFLSHDPEAWLRIPTMAKDETGQWRRISGLDRAIIIEAKIREWAAANVSANEGPLAVDLFYDIWCSSRETQATAKPGDHHEESRAKK